jgi:hypothetical protein
MFIGTLWPINDEYKQEIEVLWTAKIRFWDPTICSTSGFEDLQNQCSSRFSLQNDKDIQLFRYIGSLAREGQ